MNIPAIIIANGSAVALLLILLVSSQKTVHYGLLDHQLYRIMLLCAIFQSVVETATFLVDGKAGLNLLATVLNSLLYINNTLFVFVWTLYADYKLFGDCERLKRIYRFVAIPLVLIWVGALVNLVTPVFFRISVDNVYQRTSLFVVPFALTYLYLAYGVLLIYFYRDKVHKYLFLPAVVFMIPILLGSMLQLFFYGYSLVWLSTAIALASLYINVQNEATCVDFMTGLFTRRYLLQYLNQQLKNAASGGALTGIMLDIDHFKAINDTYGHLIGDEAIGAAGDLLRAACPAKSIAARYAGDEFIILVPVGDEALARQIVQRINEAAAGLDAAGQAPYSIRFSSGCSAYQSGDTIDTFLGRLDAAMYVDKRRKDGLNQNP